LEVCNRRGGRNELFSDESRQTLGKAEKEARLPIWSQSPNGKRTSRKLDANFLEAELPNDEAWEKERKTALAQIQNALKFCVQS
jgi:hypothetical protein